MWDRRAYICGAESSLWAEAVRSRVEQRVEPCLYYRFENDTVMLVLIYVDDILVATNDEEGKKELFADLDKAYGIKDQGLLTDYQLII